MLCCRFRCSVQSGLTMNVDGRVFDKNTERFLTLHNYRFHHVSRSCTGAVQYVPVRLSQEEAACLGKYFPSTPPTELYPPLAAEEAEEEEEQEVAGSTEHEPSGEAAGYISWRASPTQHQQLTSELMSVIRAQLGTGSLTAAAGSASDEKEASKQPAFIRVWLFCFSPSDFSMHSQVRASVLQSSSLGPSNSSAGAAAAALSHSQAIREQWRTALLSQFNPFDVQWLSSPSAFAVAPAPTALDGKQEKEHKGPSKLPPIHKPLVVAASPAAGEEPSKQLLERVTSLISALDVFGAKVESLYSGAPVEVDSGDGIPSRGTVYRYVMCLAGTQSNRCFVAYGIVFCRLIGWIWRRTPCM
jgi:hypothetical protein